MHRREFLMGALCGAAAVCLPQVSLAQPGTHHDTALHLHLPEGGQVTLWPARRLVAWQGVGDQPSWRWGGQQIPTQQTPNYPVAAAWDAQARRLYIVDRGWGCVHVLSERGQRLGRLGDGELFAPRAAQVAQDGSLLVSDAGTRQVLRFAPSGRLIGRLGARELHGPGALVVDGAGVLHVADLGQACVHRYQLNTGRHLGSYAQGATPCAMSLDAQTLWVADIHQGRLVQYSTQGAELASRALRAGQRVALHPTAGGAGCRLQVLS